MVESAGAPERHLRWRLLLAVLPTVLTCLLATGAAQAQRGTAAEFTEELMISSSLEGNVVEDMNYAMVYDAIHPVLKPLLFSDDFERDIDDFSRWSYVARAYPGRLVASNEFARRGSYSAKFAVNDEDVSPLTPTSNPRAQLNYENIYEPKKDYWTGFSVYFPPGFPDVPSDGWLIVAELGFAPPWNGSGPMALRVDPATPNQLALGRDERYGYDTIWSTPLVKGAWQDFVLHVRFSNDPNDLGYVELWLNGARQTFKDESARVYYKTLKDDSAAPGSLQVKNYRKAGMFEWATVYQDEVKVGSSYQAVAP